MPIPDLRARYQALEESHDELLSAKLHAEEDMSCCRVDVKDMAAQVQEYKDEEKGLEAELDAAKKKCIQFAQSYLDASTKLKNLEGQYADGIKYWKGKFKDADCENEGLRKAIAEQRKQLVRAEVRIRELRTAQLLNMKKAEEQAD